MQLGAVGATLVDAVLAAFIGRWFSKTLPLTGSRMVPGLGQWAAGEVEGMSRAGRHFRESVPVPTDAAQ